MANIVTLRMIIAWRTVIINNPFIIALLLFQYLTFISCFISRVRRFVAAVLFLIYVGGIMILITYCVILIPTQKFSSQYQLVSLLIAFTAILNPSLFLPNNSYPYGLLFTGSTFFLLVLLLYLVLLAVVDITGYSSGTIKMYVKN